MHTLTSPALTALFSRFSAPDQLPMLSPVLLVGPLGTGKRHHILQFIRQIGCAATPRYAPYASAEDTRTDCTCDSCTRIKTDKHPDLLFFKGNEPLADFRDRLQEHVSHQPSLLPYRVLLLSNLHRYTKDTLDTALKIIEEPPRTLKIFATATVRESMPPAVLSRFREFRTNWLPPAQIDAITAVDSRLRPYRRHLPNYPFRSVHELTAYVRYDFEAQFKTFFADLDITTLESKVTALLDSFRADPDHAPADLIEIFLDFYLTRLADYVRLNSDVRPQLNSFKANAYVVFERYAQTLGKYLRSPNQAYYINLDAQLLSLFRAVLTLKLVSGV